MRQAAHYESCVKPQHSLKTRVTEFKELTKKLAKAEENPKKMIVIASLLAVTCLIMTIVMIVLAVVFIPSVSVGLFVLGILSACYAFIPTMGAVASAIWAYSESTEIPDLRKKLEESQNSLLRALQKHEECVNALKSEISEEIEKLKNTNSSSLRTYQTALEEIAEVEKFLKNLKEVAN